MIAVVGVAERGVAARDAGTVRGEVASGVTVPDVTRPRDRRRSGFGRWLKACCARGLIGNRGVPPAEGGVVDPGGATGMVVMGGNS
ncbi:MAG TPA: hypothetical protein VHK01_08075 [Lacipirellulaceae bacterium]|nr:hypothetical protein [Lacipirellulaceae bacterium]